MKGTSRILSISLLISFFFFFFLVIEAESTRDTSATVAINYLDSSIYIILLYRAMKYHKSVAAQISFIQRKADPFSPFLSRIPDFNYYKYLNKPFLSNLNNSILTTLFRC